MKDTMMWGLFSGLALVGRCVKCQDERYLLRSLLNDSLGVSIFVEFLFNLYTFPLWVELTVLPILTMLIGMQVTAQRMPDGKLAERPFGCLAGFGGWLILAFFCMNLYQHSQKLLDYDSLRQFALPLIFTIASVPVFFMIALYAEYESFFVLQNVGDRKSFALKLYLRLKLIDLLRVGLSNIGIVHRRFSGDIIGLQTHDEVDSLCLRLRAFLESRAGGVARIRSRSLERSAARSTGIKLPMIPLFRTPWEASEFVIELGLKDAAEGEPPWRSLEPGEWYSLADLRYESGQLNWSNHVSCMHRSSDEAFIEECHWKIELRDPGAGNDITAIGAGILKRYLTELGCEIPNDIVFDKTTAFQMETSEGWFVLKSLKFNFGYGWEFLIKSKFAD